MTKPFTIKGAQEEFDRLHIVSITLQSGMMMGNTSEEKCLDGYERLENHFTQTITALLDELESGIPKEVTDGSLRLDTYKEGFKGGLAMGRNTAIQEVKSRLSAIRES